MISEVFKVLGGISPILGPSLAAFIGGAALLLDDAADFGKLGDERRPHEEHSSGKMPSIIPDLKLPPPTPHHWLLGAILMCGGVAGLGMSLLDLLASDPKKAKEMLGKLKELEIARKALPPEELAKVLSVRKNI
jgi:hypothetical protein